MACGERGAIRLSNCQPALFLGAALPSGVRREGHSGGAPLREAKDAGHLVMPGISNLTEQSENVIENKGSAQISTTPNPSLSKEGNFGLASSDGEGWPECRPEGRRYENCRNKARMSMKTKDRAFDTSRAAAPIRTICHSSPLSAAGSPPGRPHR
jgi:hypothetical protein